MYDEISIMDDDQSSFRDTIAAMQRLINTGAVWHFEGSRGRAAHDLLKAGYCILPSCYIDETMADTPLSKKTLEKHGPHTLKQPIKDAYGNMVPYREMLQDGSMGTLAYARENKPEFWEGITAGWEMVDGVKRNIPVTRK